MNNFHTVLIVVVTYFVTISYGADDKNCPPCIPTANNPCHCVEGKHKRSVCPPCIPLSKIDEYQTKCASTAICVKVKRQADDCPPCIPLYLRGYYAKNKPECSDKDVCGKKSGRDGRVKRSDCPPCIPFYLRDFYAKNKPECSDKDICGKKSGGGGEMKR